MDRSEALLAQIRDLLIGLREDIHLLVVSSKKETQQNIKESKARMKMMGKELLTETIKKTQERILQNG